MKIGIASDHRGYDTKEELKKYFSKFYDVIDYGTDSKKRVDYPIYGIKLGEKVACNEVDFGVAICGSAIGISIACNKVKGVRCGKINSVKEAIHAKEKDFVNVIAISADTSIEENIQIIEEFLKAKEILDDPVYELRKKEIIDYENKN